jgi:two-component sensor histidine kinase
MKKICLVMSLLYLSSTFLFSQKDVSLQQQAHIYINDAFAIRNSNLDSSFILVKKGEQLIRKHNIDKERGYYFHILGVLQRLSGKAELADSLLQVSISYYKKYNDQRGISISFQELGNLYIQTGDLDKANDYYNRSLLIKKKINDTIGIPLLHNGLGIVADYKGDYLKAVDLYFKAIEGFLHNKDSVNLSDAYNNISIIHYNLGNLTEAIDYQYKAIDLNKRLKNKYSESMNYVCISSFLLEKGEKPEAKKYAEDALQITKSMKNHFGTLYALAALGDVEAKTGKFENALMHYNKFMELFDADDPYMKAQVNEKTGNIYLAKRKYKEAIEKFDEAEKVYNLTGNSKELRDINRELASAYKGLNQIDKAFYYLERSNIYQDSVFNQNKVRDMMQMEAKFQNKQKEAENQKLQAEQRLKEATIKSQRKALFGGTIGLSLISFLSFLLYRLSQKRKVMNGKLVEQKDKIQLLNRELNHRVKNNLAFMTSLLEMQGRRTESAETKQALIESESRLKALALVHSQLFRSDTDTEVNLKNYLEEIKEHLLGIFSIPDKELNIVTDFCDYTINAEDAMRLGLIVNELITNSVKHAFTEVKNPKITISTNINSEGKLALNYSDNGPGISKTMGDNIKETSLGIKLIELLRKQLGERYVVVV